MLSGGQRAVLETAWGMVVGEQPQLGACVPPDTGVGSQAVQAGPCLCPVAASRGYIATPLAVTWFLALEAEVSRPRLVSDWHWPSTARAADGAADRSQEPMTFRLVCPLPSEAGDCPRDREQTLSPALEENKSPRAGSLVASGSQA